MNRRINRITNRIKKQTYIVKYSQNMIIFHKLILILTAVKLPCSFTNSNVMKLVDFKSGSSKCIKYISYELCKILNFLFQMWVTLSKTEALK